MDKVSQLKKKVIAVMQQLKGLQSGLDGIGTHDLNSRIRGKRCTDGLQLRPDKKDVSS